MSGEENSLTVGSEAELWGWDLGPLKEIDCVPDRQQGVHKVWCEQQTQNCEIAICMLGQNPELKILCSLAYSSQKTSVLVGYNHTSQRQKQVELWVQRPAWPIEQVPDQLGPWDLMTNWKNILCFFFFFENDHRFFTFLSYKISSFT